MVTRARLRAMAGGRKMGKSLPHSSSIPARQNSFLRKCGKCGKIVKVECKHGKRCDDCIQEGFNTRIRKMKQTKKDQINGKKERQVIL